MHISDRKIVALRLTGVGKQYKSSQAPGGKITAVSDITIDVYRGSFTGLVGRNGCGKSTLLKMIAGIVKPSQGKVELYGKVLAITDVGAGFHTDLTGIENIYMVGRLYGLSKEEIARRIPDITAFSEIGDFLNEPVKKYSQGMFLRLAFSLMIHLPLEIVLLDEVLAVGDAAFRTKCFKKIKELAAKGLTIIMVSHSFDEIAALCDRCLVLSHGKLMADGAPDSVYNAFVESIDESAITRHFDPEKVAGHITYAEPGFANVLSVYLKPVGNSGNVVHFSDGLAIDIIWEKLEATCSVFFEITIRDGLNRPVLTTANIYAKTLNDAELLNKGKTGVFEERCVIPAYFLNYGNFNLSVNATAFYGIKDHFSLINTVKPFPFFIQHIQTADSPFWTFSPSPVRTAMEWESAKR